MGQEISISVIKRLPRYYRFLETLKDNGIVRISSKELAERMGLTCLHIKELICKRAVTKLTEEDAFPSTLRCDIVVAL